MRTALVSISLAIVATFIAAVVEACGISGAAAATLQPGVVAGDQFVCVTTAGHLMVRDLKKETHRDFTDLKPRFLPPVDVCENRACVATAENVHVVDLATGKLLHTLPHARGPVNVGFVDKTHVFAASPEAVEVFDLTTGKLQHRVELRKPEPQPTEKGVAKSEAKPEGKTKTASQRIRGFGATPWLTEGIVPCCRHENLLFIALPTDDKRDGLDLTTLRAVAVIDLRQGRLTDKAQIARGITGLATANGRLLVRSGILSYGIPLEHCTSFPISQGKIDVKSKDVRSYDVSMRWGVETTGTTAFADGGDLVVATGKTIARLDAQGKCLATKQALAPGRELVGVWNHQPLVSEDGELKTVTLTPVEQKPAAAE